MPKTYTLLPRPNEEPFELGILRSSLLGAILSHADGFMWRRMTMVDDAATRARRRLWVKRRTELLAVFSASMTGDSTSIDFPLIWHFPIDRAIGRIRDELALGELESGTQFDVVIRSIVLPVSIASARPPVESIEFSLLRTSGESYELMYEAVSQHFCEIRAERQSTTFRVHGDWPATIVYPRE